MNTSSSENSYQADYSRLVKFAAKAATLAALLLILTKAAAWMVSGSASLLASLTDSLMDATASGLNLLALTYALRPADDEHRFGHGKMESLAALVQSTFITGSAILLIFHGIDRVLHPTPIKALGWAIGVTLFAIAVTGLLLLVQRHVIHKTGSTAIKADSLHYRSDLLLNSGILLALLLSQFGFTSADALFAIGIAVYMIWSARAIGLEAVSSLLDQALPEEEVAQIEQIATAHPKVHGIHELRTRRSGATTFIQLHLELDDEMRLVDAHAIADQIEANIAAEFAGADIIIHQDPLSAMPSAQPAVGVH